MFSRVAPATDNESPAAPSPHPAPTSIWQPSARGCYIQRPGGKLL